MAPQADTLPRPATLPTPKRNRSARVATARVTDTPVEIFSIRDEHTCDSVTVRLEGDRLIVTLDVARLRTTAVIVEPGAVQRLADGIANALAARARRKNP